MRLKQRVLASIGEESVESIWIPLLQRLLPRNALGQVELGLVPKAPRLRHEISITRATRFRSYYSLLNSKPKFRRAISRLFRNWSDYKAVTFWDRWALGRSGNSDLLWSYRCWRVGWIPSPRLLAGGRMGAGHRRTPTRPIPSGLLNDERQRLGALRLYRARALRLTWKAIAKLEAEETGRVVLDADDARRYADSIRQDVARWQRALGIPSRPAGQSKKRASVGARPTLHL
jgi:hypothetical protein